MIVIRPATPEDAPAIAHVHIASWRTTYAGLVPDAYLLALDERDRTAQWQHWLTLDVAVLVAALDGEIVGFAGGGPVREPLAGYDVELYTLYLLAAAQRQGIGSRLLAAVAEALRACGLKTCSPGFWQATTHAAFTSAPAPYFLQRSRSRSAGRPCPFSPSAGAT